MRANLNLQRCKKEGLRTYTHSVKYVYRNVHFDEKNVYVKALSNMNPEMANAYNRYSK